MNTPPDTVEGQVELLPCPDCHGCGWTWQRFGPSPVNHKATCLTCEGEGEIQAKRDDAQEASAAQEDGTPTPVSQTSLPTVTDAKKTKDLEEGLCEKCDALHLEEPRDVEANAVQGPMEGWPLGYQSRHESEFNGTPTPAHVVYIYRDELGRRCTQFVCACEGAGRDRNADADKIAALLTRNHAPWPMQAETDHENLLQCRALLNVEVGDTLYGAIKRLLSENGSKSSSVSGFSKTDLDLEASSTLKVPEMEEDSGIKDAERANTAPGQMALNADLQEIVAAMKDEPPRTQFSVCWIQRRFRRGFVRASEEAKQLLALGIVKKVGDFKFEYIGAPSAEPQQPKSKNFGEKES